MVSLSSPKQLIRKIQMEIQPPTKKDYFHYNHADPCRFSRWTARESFQFMYARPWEHVLDFYSQLVNGSVSLSTLFGVEKCHVGGDGDEIPEISDKTELESVSSNDKSGRWARITFKVVLGYHGASFDGWQKQPGLNTVQGLVERSLGKFVDEKKAQLLKDKSLPVEGCAVVAGRTDKGVTALQQVSRVFHPNFSAKWRRYLYIFPLNDEEHGEQSNESGEGVENQEENENGCGEGNDESFENLSIDDREELESGKKPQTFSVNRVNQLLRQLEGKLLSYKMFARDTKASRNVGPPTECFLYHARATEARLPSSDCVEGARIMCVELVANRFLRKMVRVLVATSIREAAAGAEEDALLRLMDATCRRATAPPAPPDGLCLVDPSSSSKQYSSNTTHFSVPAAAEAAPSNGRTRRPTH
ncbi:Pseudouridine synthase [Parasponia andersonii]|uniref:tRNA pseudouridine synthase n=1 Tax=Parasponia andersonii TaxID=3476 RepID=A0A2P5AX84_PARAD|nr:Pseudouridine synthase [Parasponia andersonii]